MELYIKSKVKYEVSGPQTQNGQNGMKDIAKTKQGK